MLSVPLLLLGAVALVFAHIVSTICKPGLRAIPGPWLAKISNLYRVGMVLRGRYSDEIVELHRTYGPTVRIGPDCVSLDGSDREVVGAIYGIRNGFPKSDWVKSSQTLFQGRVVPALMTTQDKEYHLALKKSIASAYAVTTLTKYEPAVDNTVRYFIQRLDTLFAQTGQSCPLHNWLQWYAYDVIGAITFSRPMGLLKEGRDIDNMLGEIKVEADYRAVGAVMPFIDWAYRKNFLATFLRAPTHKIMIRARAMLEERLQTLQSSEAPSRDFISRFLEAKEKNPDLLNNRNMMGFVGSNLQAGSDTTAIVLRTVMYYAMRIPSILARMREEIDELGLPHPIPYQEAYNNLPFVAAIIQESIRFHPPFALQLERFVPETGLELPDGTVLPEGTKVGMMGHTYHLNEEIFGKDAAQFNPDRWLPLLGEDEAESKKRVALMKSSDMSFGHGPRRCIGVHVAELQIYKLVPAVVHLVDMELVSPNNPWRVEQKFFSVQSGMDVWIKRREPAYSSSQWVQSSA